MTILSAVGKANVDYIIRVHDSFLLAEKLEKGGDNIVSRNNLLRILGNYPAGRQSAGGSAANTATGFAVLGGAASFHGCVGNDPQGEFYIASFERHNVSCYAQKQADKNTPICLCLVSKDGDVTYVISNENTAQINTKSLKSEVIEKSNIIHAECNLGRTTEGMAVLFDCSSMSKRTAGMFSLVLPPHNLAIQTQIKENQMRLVESADVLFGNQREYEAFFGIASINDMVEISKNINAVMNITCGNHGAVTVSQGNLYQAPAPPTLVVNAVGAGDNFAAGFLSTYRKTTNNIEEALHSAINMGRRAVATSTSRLEMHGPR